MVATIFGGVCTLLGGLIVQTAQLRRAAKDKLGQLITEMEMVIEELMYNHNILIELKKEVWKSEDGCSKNCSPVSPICRELRLDILASSRLQIGKLGCDKATLRIVSNLLGRFSLVHESTLQAKQHIAVAWVDQGQASATATSISYLKEKLDELHLGGAPEDRDVIQDGINKLSNLLTALKTDLATFNQDHPLLAYLKEMA